MGDRFYLAQKNHKPGRRLKVHAIAELDELLDTKVEGLNRLTIKSIDSLTAAIIATYHSDRSI